MITATTPVFPNNAIAVIKTSIESIDPDLRIFRRPLRSSDPAQSVGIFGQQWLPNEESMEMGAAVIGGGPKTSEPTLSSYIIGIQAFVKDFDEERGLNIHSVLSKLIRSTLYRNPALMVALRALTVTMDNSTERTQRYGIRTVRYLSNEIDGNFLYLSTMEFYLETEIF